jgi:iron(III) transport system permease protein
VLQVMRKILLPLLKPALVYAWLWMALLCYRELTMASVLVTNQNNVTLPMIVWGLWLGGSLNQAAAANLVILVFMLPAVLVYLTMGRRSRLEETP